MFPLNRNRRLRSSEVIRSLVRETIISPNDFLVPLFVVEGKGIKEEIPSMPNYYRYSLDLLQQEVKDLWKFGLKSVLLFVKVPENQFILFNMLHYTTNYHILSIRDSIYINFDGVLKKTINEAMPRSEPFGRIRGQVL